MARMLYDTIKTVLVFAIILYLKNTEGVVVSKKCLIKSCTRLRANKRGLCLVCYSRAKAKVDAGETTWDRLVDLGLCEAELDPFDDAYSRAVEGE